VNAVIIPVLTRLTTHLRHSSGSLRTQLIFWNILALTLLLGGLTLVCRFAMSAIMLQSVDHELAHSIDMYRHPPMYAMPGRMRPAELLGMGPMHPPLRPPDVNDLYRTHFYDSLGRNVMRDERRPTWDAVALARAGRGETVYTTTMVNGEPVRVISTVGYSPRGVQGLVQKGYSLKEIRRALGGIDTALLLLIPFGLIGAGWLGAALTNRVLRRVHLMTRAAADVSDADFARRLPVSGNDEFAELAATFNGLLGRLDQAYQNQRQLLELQQRFTADASHELKTPLTIVRGHASLAQERTTTDERSRHAFQEIATAATTMSHLVQDLLLLAHSDEGQLGRGVELLSVREVLESAQEQALREEAAPIALRIEDEALCFRGNEAELTRLFRNLLDNAVRYTPSDRNITLTACGKHGNIMVTVADTGEGIAPEHLPHLGERFYRVDTSRTRPTGGTGLGLSICRSIVEAHHGTLSFHSALQRGTTATVTLPQEFMERGEMSGEAISPLHNEATSFLFPEGQDSLAPTRR
jgi:signal transduction histidine kinase